VTLYEIDIWTFLSKKKVI